MVTSQLMPVKLKAFIFAINGSKHFHARMHAQIYFSRNGAATTFRYIALSSATTIQIWSWTTRKADERHGSCYVHACSYFNESLWRESWMPWHGCSTVGCNASFYASSRFVLDGNQWRPSDHWPFHVWFVTAWAVPWRAPHPAAEFILYRRRASITCHNSSCKHLQTWCVG